MSHREWNKKELFNQQTYVRESDLFLKMRQRAKEKQCEHMMLAPSEARLLQSLVEVHSSQKIVEIGTLFGYSALYLAQGIWGEGKVWTLEKNPENASIAKSFIAQSKMAEKVEVVEGDAHENLKRLEEFGPFDCAFIDADKAGYPHYLEWAEKNIRKHGLIIVDNTILGGAVWGDQEYETSATQVKAMMEFHQNFSDVKRFRSVIYPSFDGLAVGVKV
jgi:predicted O-methyltransferase YrrM